MCGIIGMISRRESGFYTRDKSVLDQLLFVNQIRGDDSTGLFGVRKSGNVDIVKEAAPAANTICTKEYDDFQTQMVRSHKFVIGHNRKATRGDIKDENTHPFYEGNVVLVHNGTLFDHKKLADVDVDSHAICHSIEAHGHNDTLLNLKGAYALAWYDNRDRTLRLARNNERPLSVLYNDDFFWFASEASMLFWILGRNGLNLDQNKVKLVNLVPDKIYEFNLDKYTNMVVKNIEVPEVASPEPKKSQPINLLAYKGGKETPSEGAKRSCQTQELQASVVSSLPSLVSNDLVYDQYVVFKFNYHELRDENPQEFPWSNTYALDCDCRFVGTSAAHPGITFIAYTYKQNIEWLLRESSDDLLGGEVLAIRRENGKPKVITLLNIKPEGGVFTKNGKLLNSSIWSHINHTCDVCQQQVYWGEVSKSYVDYHVNVVNNRNTYRKKRIVCSTCFNQGK